MEMLGPALNLETHSYQSQDSTRNTLTTIDAPEAPLLPLWLTEREAAAVIQLCGGSMLDAGEAEDTLFAKLGDLYRAFRR